MRKSFTRFLSLLVLLCTFSIYAVAQVPALSPAERDTNVKPGATGTTFTMTFAAGSVVTVNSGAGIISLNNYSGGPVELEPIQVTTTLPSSVVINGNVVEVTFSTTLTEQGWYYITVSADAFNVNGAAWAGIAANPTINPANDAVGGNYEWEFQVGDWTKPIATLFPPDGSIHAGYGGVGVAPNTNLVLTFNEEIQLLAGGSFALYNGPINPDDNVNVEGNVVDLIENTTALATAGVINIGGYTITIDGTGAMTHNRITISGLSNLTPLGNYYARVTRGTITDMSGNPEGDFTYNTNDNVFNDNTTWDFRAADVTPPTVDLSFPDEAAYVAGNSTAGFTNVSQTPSLVLTFSDDRTANGDSFTLQKSTTLYNDTETAGSVALDPVVAADLDNMITVAGGATIDWPNATMVNNVATIPLTGLATHTLYTVTVNDPAAPGVPAGPVVTAQDGEGNNLVTKTFNFTTGDFTRPQFLGATVRRNSPTDQLVDIYVDDDTQMNDRRAAQNGVYTEPINIWVKVVAQGATPPTAAEVKADNLMLTWDGIVDDRFELENHDFGLACDTEYDFYFYAEDEADSKSGINVMTDLDVAGTNTPFVATDNCINPPVVTFSAASANEGDAGRDADVIITFDEEVKWIGPATNWNDVITLTVPDGTFGATDGNPDPITFNATINGANKVITLSELHADQYEVDNATTAGDDFAELLSNTTYTLTLDKDLFTDDASGAGGISNLTEDDDVAAPAEPQDINYGTDNKLAADFVTTFATEDYQGPVATFNPVDGAGITDPTIVDVNVHPTITFDEKIFTEAGVAITNANITGGPQDYVELVEVAGGQPNVPATITIDATGTVVTIVPTVTLNSEQQYRIKISSLIEDQYGFPVFTYRNTAQDIESFTTPAATEAVFEVEDTQTPAVVITAVDAGGGADATVGNDVDKGTVAVPNNAEFRITFAEGVREVASNTLINAADENMIRSLITLTGPAGDVEFNVIQVINPAANPPAAGAPNDNPTIVYIDPIDYPAAYLFTAGATYNVAVTGVEDDNSNNVDANQDITIFETPPTPTVTLSSSMPGDGDGDVPLVGQNLVLNFDKSVNANAVAMTVNAGAWLNANAGTPSNNGKTWTYALPTPLTSDAAYTVNIAQNAFTAVDAPNPSWPTAVAGADIDFTTVDETAPRIDLDTDVTAVGGGTVNANAIPAAGAGDVELDDVLVFDFDSDIDLGTGDFWIKRVDNGTTVAQLSTTSGAFEITTANPDQLRVDLSYASLDYDVAYFIEMDGTFVTDEATTPNDFEWERSVAAPGTWNAGGFFNVGALPQGNLQFRTWTDTPQPYYAAITTFVPAQAANDVDPAITDFQVKFTEPVELAAVGTRQLEIDDQSGPTAQVIVNLAAPGVVTMSSNGLTATISLTAAGVTLSDNTDYHVNIDPSSFVSTEGSTLKYVTDTNPSTWVGGDSNFGTTTGWYFTTKDATRPQIASIDFNPANDGTAVDKNAQIIVTFTENVALVGAWTWDDVFDFNAYVYTPNQGVDGTFDAGTAADVDIANTSLAGNVLTITLDAPLEVTVDARTVTMTVNAGRFADLSPAANTNLLNPFVVAGDQTFVVEDERKPIATAITNNGAVLSPNGDRVTITIDTDEDVTAYVVAVANGATAPVEADFVGAQSMVVDATDVAKVFTLTGLLECGDYDLYVMLKDGVGNYSDALAAAGNQPYGPYNKRTSDVTPPSITDTYPTNGGTIEVFTQRYGATDTPLKIYFDEQIAWTGVPHNFVVREYETNVDVGVTATLKQEPAPDNRYYVELVPTLGNWAGSTHYYVEMDYGCIEDVPCWGVANDYEEAYYGKSEFHFFTNPLYVAPAFASSWPADDEDLVVFTQPDEMTITYTQPVQINYSVGTPVYIYRYDDPGANPQEIISVTPSYVSLSADGKTVKMRVDHLLTPTLREHYRVKLPANMIWDAFRDNTTADGDPVDPTTTNDLTPLNGPASVWVATGTAADNRADGDWWDFWALDQTNPNYAWTSDWVDNYVPDNYGGDKINNFPLTDAAAFQEGDLTWDNSDDGVGDPAATRNIYLEFNEDIYVGGVLLGQGANVTANFTFKDALNNAVTFTATYDRTGAIAGVARRVIIVPTSNYVSERAYTVTVASNVFKDVDGNDLTTQGSTTYDFKGWLGVGPDVTITAQMSTYDAGRVATRPLIYVTFDWGVLLKNNYQPLREIDFKDLVKVNGGTDYTIVGGIPADNKSFVIQPNTNLGSESNLAVTINDNIPAPALVDIIRAYTLNSNDFTDNKTVNFTVEDYINPTAVFNPIGTNVNPLAPIGAGNGQFLQIICSEPVAVDATVTDKIEVRRAWVTGPQSEGPGSIFQLSAAGDLTVTGVGGNIVNIPIVGNGGQLEEFTGYYVKIPSGLIVDAAGLPYTGVNNNTTWTFATDDGTPPMVVDSNPELTGRPSNFPVTENFWLQFDENIVRGAGNFVIYKRDPIHSDTSDGNAVQIVNAADPLNVLISGSDPANGLTSDIVTIKHEELDKNFIYYIRYDAGVVVDNNANPNEELYNFDWDFTTSAHAQPILLTLTPDGTTVGQEPVLTMTFDSSVPIRRGTGNLRIYEYFYDVAVGAWDTRLVHTVDILGNEVSLANNVVTIDPVIKLDDNVTKYYVLVDASAITNTTTGDFFAGIADDTQWTFSTVDELDGPTLAATDGYVVNGDCLDPAAVTLTLTLEDFNGIAAGAGNFMVYEYVDGTNDVLAETIPATDATRVTVTSVPDAEMYYSSTLTVEITPANLLEQKDYYVMVGANAITDGSRGVATAFDGSVIGVNDWKFSTDDVTAPDFVAASFGPVGIDEESDVTLTISFDEDVQPGTGMIKVFNATTNTQVFSTAVDASQITGTDVSIPVTGLADETQFYVTYDAGFVKDLPYGTCGTTRDCSAFTGSWIFTTDDNTAPVVDEVNIQPGATGLETTFDIIATFNEDVQPGAGMIKVFEFETQTEVMSTAITADMIAGNILTVTISGLDEKTTYYFVSEDDMVKDMAINPNSFVDGASDPEDYQFTTGDFTAPTVVGVTPADNTADLDNTFTVTLTFSEDVTVAATDITATGGTATVTPGTGTTFDVDIVSTDGSTVVLTVNNTIVDGGSNPLDQVYTYTYVVADDNVEPTIISVVPGSSTGMNNTFSVVVTFSEPVNGAVTGIDVTGETSSSVDGVNGDAVYTVNITADDLADVTLTIPVTVTDIAGNALEQQAVYTYTIGDHQAPTFTALTPLNGAQLSDSHPAELVMTFDEDVMAGAGNIAIYNGATAEKTFSVTDAAVTISGSTVTITLDTGLDKNTNYFVYVDAGFVTDLSGNEFAGINSPSIWTFTTGDFPTGTNPEISLEFKVYPNPFVNELRVDNASELSRIVISSVTGQKVKEIVRPTSTIQTNDLRSGVYFISLYVDDVVAKTERIVKR